MNTRPLLVPMLLASAVALSTIAHAGDDVPDSRTVLTYLASPELNGRLTGTPEELKAANYLAEQLTKLGAKPLPGRDSLIEPFDVIAGLRDDGSSLALSGPDSQIWDKTESFQALSLSDNGSVTGTLVVAGYGIRVDEDGVAYDSFAGIDVKDKIVLVFRYSPEKLDEKRRTFLRQRPAELRTKAMTARELGAKALLVTAGPTQPAESDIVPATFDTALAGSGIVAGSVSRTALETILKAGGKSLKDLEVFQQRLDAGDPSAKGFDIPGIELRVSTKVAREKRVGHNVVGYFPQANAPLTSGPEVVLVGAHFDHLGDGRNAGSSLARDSEKGKPHVGADDNGSGSTAVVRIAQLLAKEKLKRPVVVALWSAEEIGVLGSKAFISNGPLPSPSIAGYVNLDMVGRLRDEKLTVMGVGSSDAWKGLIERANKETSLSISQVSDPYNPTDSMSFYLANVPVVNLFTGGHEDYHRPTDTADKINYVGLEKIAQFGKQLVTLVANQDERLIVKKVERKGGSSTGGRARFRGYIGTIPDYSSEIPGVKVSGTVGGSPAAEAGIKEGDVIVDVEGRKITNIHDYMNVLETLKIGTPAHFGVLRGGKRIETTLTPAARK